MDERLAVAEAALKAGRGAEAIEPLIGLLTDQPAQALAVYRALLFQLFSAGRHTEGEHWSALAARRFPRDMEVWNVRGVMLRKLGRHREALEALEQAVRLAPGNSSPLANMGNVLMDSKNFPKAEAVFTKLARKDPRNAEHQRQIGRALKGQGKRDAALVRFRQAVNLKKENVDCWLDLIGLLTEDGLSAEAEEAANRALAAIPGASQLLEAKCTVIRRTGQLRRAEAYLLELLPAHEDAAWLHYQLGSVICEYDRERGNLHMHRAIGLNPMKLDYLMALAESLERTRTGDEGANIEESYLLLRRAMDLGVDAFSPAHLKVAYEILVRVAAFADMDALGGVSKLGRIWAESGRHTALLKLLGQVRTPEDRHELLELHRVWGRYVEAHAARDPIRLSPPRPAGGKIRLGFMSSDLRRHPVGYFALPLFEHLDRDRFEVFCYSFSHTKSDPVQEFITKQVTAYRWDAEMSFREAAQMIADDQLDILIELGGTTHMNKLEVMAYKPAPKQASWLGYPHSAGLSTIDYLVCDSHIVPPDRSLLIEQPLMMPKSWIALGRMVFSEGHLITAGVPQDRHGSITFGTANNPHKYNRELIRTWARVLLAVPDSRFLFVRPEGGTASFTRNIRAEFEAAGVSPERIQFHTVRGHHMPVYNEIDITLDTFPLTGGTTTTEALWMGVPVVSLVGEAFFERLSASILANAGVGDMATTDKDRYVEIAVELAADRPRRLALRHSLRDTIKAGPLGQTEQFAADFYDMIARTVRPYSAAALAEADRI